MHDTRLVPGALIAWAATWLIIVLGHRTQSPAVVALLVAGVATLIPLMTLRKQQSVSAMVALAIALTVPVTTAVRVHFLSSNPIANAAKQGAFLTAEVQLTSDPVNSGSGTRANARVSSVTLRGHRHVVRTPVHLSLPQDSVGLLPGTTLRIAAIAGPARVGQRAAAVLKVSEFDVLSGPALHQRIAGDIRQGLRTSVQGRPPDAAALLPSLAIGDTSLTTTALIEDMRSSGLAHLTVVSGANVTIVLLAVFLPLSAVRMNFRVRAAIAALVLAAFVVVARPDPSVLRAAVMGGVSLLAILKGLARNLSGGSNRSLAALCVAIITLVLWDPWLATSWGFALSVAATAGLILGSRRMGDWLTTHLHVRHRFLADAVSVAVVAQIAVTPVLVAMGVGVSPIAIPANILAAPAVAPATISGLSAAAVAPFWPEASRWIAVPGTWATGWIAAVARRAATIDLPHGPTWIPRDARVVMCHVGQGTSLLIRDDDGHAVMFDVGPEPDLIDECLDRLKIQVIDLLVLTHFHADHVDGLSGVLEHRKVGQLVVSPLLSPSDRAAMVSGYDIPTTIAAKGQVWVWRDVQVDVLWPGQWLDSPSPENDHSVVCEISIEGMTVLATGDIELAAQRILAQDLDHSDVMTMPHHGSAKQSPKFARAVHPDVVLIPVGRKNEYGHPHVDAIELYRSLGAVIGRTDQHGTLAVAHRGGAPVLLIKP